jgi:hypothetical protein
VVDGAAPVAGFAAPAGAGAVSGVSVIDGRVNAGPAAAVVLLVPARSVGAGGDVAHPASSASVAPAVSHCA